MAYTGGHKHYLVDIHVHGRAAYDTRTRRQDDIIPLANIDGTHGTSALLPAIYPGPIELMRDHMDAVRRAMTAQRSGVQILGVYLEGPFLNPERAGSLDGKSFAEPSVEMLRNLVEDNEDIIKIVSIAPDLPGALKIIECRREKGFLGQMGQ